MTPKVRVARDSPGTKTWDSIGEYLDERIGDLALVDNRTLHLSNAVPRLLLALCLRWEQEAHTWTERSLQYLGWCCPRCYVELYLRPVLQTFIQVLSERMVHFNKGPVEVGKSMCSGFRWQPLYRTHSNGHTYLTLHDRGRLL